MYDANAVDPIYTLPESVPTSGKGKYNHLPTKSAKIRAMYADGMKKYHIAKALGIRPQMVYNILAYPLKKEG